MTALLALVFALSGHAPFWEANAPTQRTSTGPKELLTNSSLDQPRGYRY